MHVPTHVDYTTRVKYSRNMYICTVKYIQYVIPDARGETGKRSCEKKENSRFSPMVFSCFSKTNRQVILVSAVLPNFVSFFLV